MTKLIIKYHVSTHPTYNDVSPVANLLTLLIILTSSNECMACLTYVLFTVVLVSIIKLEMFYAF